MARTVTLAQMRNDARLYCDNRTSTPAGAHITDTELNRLINLQLAELHETLVSARGADYGGTLTESTIAVISGTSTYSLPATFMQLVAIWINWGDQDIEIIENVGTVRELEERVSDVWQALEREANAQAEASAVS